MLSNASEEYAMRSVISDSLAIPDEDRKKHLGEQWEDRMNCLPHIFGIFGAAQQNACQNRGSSL